VARALRKELIKRTRALTETQARLRCLEHAVAEQGQPSIDCDALYELECENSHLRKQIGEMEAFLADYGLVWVGTRDGDDDGQAEGGTPAAGCQGDIPGE
jgi:hypothetical protein